MDFNDAEKIVESGEKKPLRTIIIIIVLLAMVGFIAWVSGFFGEKGKQHATTSQENQQVVTPVDKNKPSKAHTHIKQKTEGDQSPSIVSEGDVNINFGKE